MIPFDLRYIRVESAEEAVDAWIAAEERGETAHYLGGGTEIVTFARRATLKTDCVIDYTRIPQATTVEAVSEAGAEWLAYGAAIPINRIADGDHQGLVRACLAAIADRTVRNSITLGGNICGMLPYREAVLPWLLSDGLVETVGPEGSARRPIAELFDKRLMVAPGELALRFLLPAGWTESAAVTAGSAPGGYYGPRTHAGSTWFYQRRTKDPRVDYPLVTLALSIFDGSTHVALTGSWGYPARAGAVEEAVREAGGAASFVEEAGSDDAGLRERISLSLDAEGRRFREDQRGSAAYRRELTIQAIAEGLVHIARNNGADR